MLRTNKETFRWLRVLILAVIVIVLSAIDARSSMNNRSYLPQVHQPSRLLRQDGRIVWVSVPENQWHIDAVHIQTGHTIIRPAYETGSGRESVLFLDREGDWIIEGRDWVNISPGDDVGLLSCERMSTQGKNFYLGQCGTHVAFGAGSPENMFACADVPNTVHYEYADCYERIDELSARGFNEAYIILMNVGGDAKDTWPWCEPVDRRGSQTNNNMCYDEIKMRYLQDLVIYGNRMGIVFHFLLGEQEEANALELDNGTFGSERMKFLWNMSAWLGFSQSYFIMSEEFDSTGLSWTVWTDSMCYMKFADPLTITGLHQYSHAFESVFSPFVGSDCFDVFSLQTFGLTHPETMIGVADSLSEISGLRPVVFSEPQAIDTHGVEHFCNQATAVRSKGYGIHFFHRSMDQKLKPHQIPVRYSDCYD